MMLTMLITIMEIILQLVFAFYLQI